MGTVRLQDARRAARRAKVPLASCSLKSMPDLESMSIESCAYMSSLHRDGQDGGGGDEVRPCEVEWGSSGRSASYLRLNLKLNCQVQVPGTKRPWPLQKVRPSWMILSRSTLHFR